MFEITAEFVFKFTKFSVALVAAWPPNETASRSEKIIFDIKWWILWIHSAFVSVPTAYTAYIDRRHMIPFTKCLCISITCYQAPIKMVICKVFQKQMQFVLEELENHVLHAGPYERDLFLDCAKKCGTIHISFLIYVSITILMFVTGPIILPQSFPLDLEYPFPVNFHPVSDIIFIHHSIIGFQYIAMIALDCQMAMILWCVIVRLKVLQTEMTKVKNVGEFNVCVVKHQYLLWLASKVTIIVRYILLTTVIMATFSIILAGMNMLANQPLMARLQFATVSTTFSGILLLNAWPSEILMRTCEGIGTALYDSEWLTSDYGKKMIMIMQRAGKPPVIAVAGLLPVLSLNYYTAFLSRAFSFFTTLRILFAKIESD